MPRSLRPSSRRSSGSSRTTWAAQPTTARACTQRTSSRSWPSIAAVGSIRGNGEGPVTFYGETGPCLNCAGTGGTAGTGGRSGTGGAVGSGGTSGPVGSGGTSGGGGATGNRDGGRDAPSGSGGTTGNGGRSGSGGAWQGPVGLLARADRQELAESWAAAARVLVARPRAPEARPARLVLPARAVLAATRPVAHLARAAARQAAGGESSGCQCSLGGRRDVPAVLFLALAGLALLLRRRNR